MAKKRKDQRFVVSEATEKQVFSILGEGTTEELFKTRAALEVQIQRVSAALEAASTEALSHSLALQSGRRGEARFEIDPDGRMVLVVSYGGEEQEPLSRREATPAWNKRNERKPKAAKPKPKAAAPSKKIAEPPKKKGFVKTSVAVTPTRVIPSDDLDDLDDILNAFDEDAAPTTEDDTAEATDSYTPSSRPRLRRIPGQAVKRGRGNGKTLSAIMSMSETKNGDDPV